MGDSTTLTPEQRAAVSAEAGPLLLVAGPGSGKTLVLAARVAFLVRRCGIPPTRVLALTFGARAAGELRGRLVRVLGEHGARVEVATFHSWGFRLSIRWYDALGLPSGVPAVLSRGQAIGYLRTAAAAIDLDPARWPPEALIAGLERLRQRDGSEPAPSPWHELLEAYDTLLRRRGVADYAAMLDWPLRLLRERSDIRYGLQEHYRAILCDEAQDCSPAQYRLLQQLADRHRHLTLVADPRQAIYGWRGADGLVLHRFLAEFPECRVLHLAQNFRSSGRIVALANALWDPFGTGGATWTANPPGEPIVLHLADDEEGEADFVAAEIARLLSAGLVGQAGEVAVLYREHRQRLPVAEALVARGLPTSGSAGTDAVQLRTIHQAKGAEWSVVFLIGLEEGLLPHHYALESDREEEIMAERRLAYVAVTRPRHRLYLTWCRQRRVGFSRLRRRPSRFLAGLPVEPFHRAA